MKKKSSFPLVNLICLRCENGKKKWLFALHKLYVSRKKKKNTQFDAISQCQLLIALFSTCINFSPFTVAVKNMRRQKLLTIITIPVFPLC